MGKDRCHTRHYLTAEGMPAVGRGLPTVGSPDGIDRRD